MPEGHTIHRLAKLHDRLLKGRTLGVTSPQGRFAEGAKKIDDRRLETITPHGKHLFYRFDNGLSMHIHLGMHGAFRVIATGPKGEVPEPVGQVRVRLVGGTKIVELTGPTACETLDEAGVKKIRDRLGPDVLDPRADREIVWKRVSVSKAPVGILLMDQSVVSGIGNVYRSEVLLRQKVHPLLPGNKLGRDAFDRLWEDSVGLLKIGVKQGRIVTVDADDVGVPIAKAGRDQRFLIYRRPTCRRCGGKVMQCTLAGRDCFLCPADQKLPRGVKKPSIKMTPVVAKAKASRGRDHGDGD